MLSLLEAVMDIEFELQYFERKQGLPYGIYWVLKEIDSRDKCNLKKVIVPRIDHRNRYYMLYVYIYIYIYIYVYIYIYIYIYILCKYVLCISMFSVRLEIVENSFF